jgi:hypothetical protein
VGGHGGIAGLHDGIKRAPLVGRVALDRLDQVGNEVVALLKLDVDVGEGLPAALPQRNKAIVGHGKPQAQQHENCEDDPAGVAHGAASCFLYRPTTISPGRD